MNADRLRLAHTGLHPERVRSLVATWGSEAGVCRALASGRIDAPDRARAAAGADPKTLAADLAAKGVRYVAPGDPKYPASLAAYPDRPAGLFVRGALPDRPAVAVVGTRRCTSYGRGMAREYGVAVAEAGWVLVSGLARGIDGAAHQGTIRAEGIGVAVLGSGIDVIYPPEHAPLADRLVELGGAVVSEYPPGTRPDGWRFPLRNRIISGMAGAVVVVEAGVRGGALITAALAIEQGVPVFAVPGDVERATSRGTNLLIRDGAHPVLDADDLVEELSLILGPPPRPFVAEPAAVDR